MQGQQVPTWEVESMLKWRQRGLSIRGIAATFRRARSTVEKYVLYRTEKSLELRDTPQRNSA